MSDLLREINDEMKAEKLQALWREFQMPIITGLVVFLLGVAGFTYWNHKQYETNAAATSLIITALDQKDQSAALVKAAGDATASPIMLMLAATEAAKTDSAKAISIYQSVIAHKDTPDILKSRAILDSILLQLNEPKKLVSDKTLADLKTIIDNNDMFTAEAHLLSGLIQKDILQKPSAAKVHFKAVVDDVVAPSSLKERAKALLMVATIAEQK